MAIPSCPRCGKTSFEMNSLKVRGANFNYHSVNCSACGCVVAVQEQYNISALLAKLADRLRIKLM